MDAAVAVEGAPVAGIGATVSNFGVSAAIAAFAPTFSSRSGAGATRAFSSSASLSFTFCNSSASCTSFVPPVDFEGVGIPALRSSSFCVSCSIAVSTRLIFSCIAAIAFSSSTIASLSRWKSSRDTAFADRSPPPIAFATSSSAKSTAATSSIPNTTSTRNKGDESDDDRAIVVILTVDESKR
jgi:hypothetical protein